MGPPVHVMLLLQYFSTMVLATRAQNTAWRSSSEAVRRVVGRKAKRKEMAKAMNKIMRILVPCLTMIDGFGNFGVWNELVQLRKCFQAFPSYFFWVVLPWFLPLWPESHGLFMVIPCHWPCPTDALSLLSMPGALQDAAPAATGSGLSWGSRWAACIHFSPLHLFWGKTYRHVMNYLFHF